MFDAKLKGLRKFESVDKPSVSSMVTIPGRCVEWKFKSFHNSFIEISGVAHDLHLPRDENPRPTLSP